MKIEIVQRAGGPRIDPPVIGTVNRPDNRRISSLSSILLSLTLNLNAAIMPRGDWRRQCKKAAFVEIVPELCYINIYKFLGDIALSSTALIAVAPNAWQAHLSGRPRCMAGITEHAAEQH